MSEIIRLAKNLGHPHNMPRPNPPSTEMPPKAKANQLLNESIARRLRWTRAVLGLSQTAMAKALHIKRPTYTEYECATFRMTVPVAINLCHLAGVTLDWIYRGNLEFVRDPMRGKLERAMRADPNPEFWNDN
jgi:DNA-binding XRE family transcriptional regulator